MVLESVFSINILRDNIITNIPSIHLIIEYLFFNIITPAYLTLPANVKGTNRLSIIAALPNRIKEPF